MFSLVFQFFMGYVHGNLNHFTMYLPGEYIIAQKWETIFTPLPQKHPLLKSQPFGIQHHQITPI